MELTGLRVLAFGTRGAQGAGLAEAIENAGATPVLVSSDGSQVEQWQAAGLEAVTADLAQPESIGAAAALASAAVLHLPLRLYGPASQAVVESVLALRAAGLGVSINLGSPVLPEGAPDPQGTRLRAERLTASGAAVVTPTVYLENHLIPPARAALIRGELLYPLPETVELAWITARDVTRAAVAALEGEPGRLYALAGPEILSFVDLAAEIGTGAGHDVTFRRVTPREYADLLRPVVGDEAAVGIEAAYASMPQNTTPLMAFDAAATWKELGVDPTSVRQWAAAVLAPVGR